MSRVDLPDDVRALVPIAVEGPVTVEVFTVARSDDRVLLTGPCGAAPWLIEAGPGEHPLETARRVVQNALPELLLVHSTSWRYEHGALVLSFVAVIPEGTVREMDVLELGRTDLARGGTHDAPAEVAFEQVVEHGLRHLSWLTREDEVVRDTLDHGWQVLLEAWVPEPFRQLP